MNPCTSSPQHMPRGHGGAGGSAPNAGLESHAMQLLEMGAKEEYEELRDLLHSWDVADLLPHLQDEAINVDELQMIKRHHLSELLRNFRFGTRIRFEHHLERWRRWLNVPLQGGQDQGSGHCNGCRCSEMQAQAQSSLRRCQQPMVEMNDSETQNDVGSKNVDKDIPPLVALSDQRTMTVPFQTIDPKETDGLMMVKQEQPSMGGGIGVGGVPLKAEEEDPSIAIASIFAGGEDQMSSSGDQEVSVLGILQAYGMKAQSLLERIGQNTPLDAVQRLLLIQLVCSFYEDNHLHLTLQRSHLLEREILQLFPCEELHYYRTERRGKIYVRFTNMKRSKRATSSRPDSKRRRADNIRQAGGQMGPQAKTNVNSSATGEQTSSPDRSE
ncbi:LOW QUALITY PROTEIN: uncharacterized protein LOC110177080 [Drosophila serrata]|uniref:LOW QUALITY PROTEIN: uncharacterized protein LOC110177080 n=1 Tax=Drosophila serrata TaxID=7274 RepID=UPI000A1CF490|nr:LOW QUALITY PROTEIN: uncharacterized protein LOC110177080 [Drosophila serrata]